MNKLSHNEYLKLIHDNLVRNYGSTLCEGRTCMLLSRKLLRRLSKFLYFHPQNDPVKIKHSCEHLSFKDRLEDVRK